MLWRNRRITILIQGIEIWFVLGDNCANCVEHAICVNGHCECEQGFEGNGEIECKKLGNYNYHFEFQFRQENEKNYIDFIKAITFGFVYI